MKSGLLLTQTSNRRRNRLRDLERDIDASVQEERRRAVRTLLARPLLVENNAARVLVNRHQDWLRLWFSHHLGWELDIDASACRLYKRPADTSDDSRPCRDPNSKEIALTRRGYVFLCLILSILVREERQLTLKSIAEQVGGIGKANLHFGEKGIPLELDRRETRRDLVHALRVLLDWSVLTRIDGYEEGYLSSEDVDVLYNVNRSILTRLLAARQPPSLVETDDHEQRLNEIWSGPALASDSDDWKSREMRFALFRRLLDDPVLYYADLGDAKYLTLGCGMEARKGSGAPNRWFFITPQRIGIDLELTELRTPLTKRQLATKFETSEGTVYERAGEYRSAVDDHLFKLGNRYAPLIDLLIQLRQPQLMRDMKEDVLSNALSEALPPIGENIIKEVAESFEGLDGDRQRTEGFREMLDTVENFRAGYSQYLAVAIRRLCKVVREGHSQYEAASRHLREIDQKLAATRDTLTFTQTKSEKFTIELATLEAEIQTLRDSPEMRSKRDLDEANKHATQCEEQSKDAQKDLESEHLRNTVDRDRCLSTVTETEEKVRSAEVNLDETIVKFGNLVSSWQSGLKTLTFPLSNDWVEELSRWLEEPETDFSFHVEVAHQRNIVHGELATSRVSFESERKTLKQEHSEVSAEIDELKQGRQPEPLTRYTRSERPDDRLGRLFGSVSSSAMRSLKPSVRAGKLRWNPQACWMRGFSRTAVSMS